MAYKFTLGEKGEGEGGTRLTKSNINDMKRILMIDFAYAGVGGAIAGVEKLNHDLCDAERG